MPDMFCMEMYGMHGYHLMLRGLTLTNLTLHGRSLLCLRSYELIQRKESELAVHCSLVRKGGDLTLTRPSCRYMAGSKVLYHAHRHHFSLGFMHYPLV